MDPRDEKFDERLGKHLTSLFFETPEDETADGHLPLDLLKDYIGYARSNFAPQLSAEAQESLKHAYVEMRKLGSNKGQITAYPRQLESLIRLAEAHAKLCFKNVVDLDDVDEAKRLHREALKQAAMDPTSGLIDISILTTGMSVTNRKRRDEISGALRQLLNSMHAQKATSGEASQLSQINFSFQNVYQEFKEGSRIMITYEMFEDAVKQLKDDGFITITGKQTIRLV